MPRSVRPLLRAVFVLASLIGPAGAADPAPLPGTTLMQRRFLDIEPIRRDPQLRWKVRSVAGAAKEEWTNCLEQDGVMYGTARGVLHAIDVGKGELLWTRAGPGGHPAILGDTVYAAGTDRFYAVDRGTGEVKWETPTSRMLCGWAQSYGFMKPATVIVDGVAFFGAKSTDTNDCHYHAVDLATGRLLWKVKPGNEPWTARPIVANGRLYGSCHFDPSSPEETGVWRRPLRGNGLVALDVKTGNRVWFRPGKSTVTNPVFEGGTLYIARTDEVEAIDAETGATLWTAAADIGGNITGLALHDGVLVAGGAGPRLVAIDVATRQELWRHREPAVKEILSPLICRDVVIVSTCGKVGPNDFETGRNSPIVGLDLKTGRKLWQCLVPGSDCLENGKRWSWNSYVCGWAFPADNRLFAFSFTGCFYCFEEPPR